MSSASPTGRQHGSESKGLGKDFQYRGAHVVGVCARKSLREVVLRKIMAQDLPFEFATCVDGEMRRTFLASLVPVYAKIDLSVGRK